MARSSATSRTSTASGGAEVYIVGGGPYGEFDVPAVRAFIRIFAPRRGEIVVDAEALDLRPPKRRRAGDPDRPRAPRDVATRTAPAEAGGATPRPDGAAIAGCADAPSAASTPAAPTDPPTPTTMTLEIDVLTLFPAMVEGPLAASIPGRIQERGLATIRIHDLREWGIGRHRSGRRHAVRRWRRDGHARRSRSSRRSNRSGGRTRLVILLDPVGEVFRHDRAADLPTRSHLVFVCPRYEGVDERIRAFVDLELSIGDYVVTGGELPALVVIDAVIRLLPGAIDDLSTAEESFAGGLLEYPQYTRPPSFRGWTSPRS